MRTFSKSYALAFPVHQVFAAWLSNDTVIPPASRMEIQAKVGGIYRLIMPNGFVAEGVFSEIVSNERVRYSWRWSGSDEPTEVEVRFRENSRGTEIHIEHRGFLSEPSLRDHSEGWDRYISGFESHLNSAARGTLANTPGESDTGHG